VLQKHQQADQRDVTKQLFMVTSERAHLLVAHVHTNIHLYSPF